ncbi:MAG: lipoprotein-releasing ABC transporter permease subunit [Pseudomonadota bacterium]
MSFELFVATRYLFARRKQAFISVISVMAILGVALGVASLIVVMGVMNGFTTDLREKILGANAHGIVMSYKPEAMCDVVALEERISSVPGLVGQTPFIYSETMLSTPRGVKGVILRGIDPESAPDVLTILDRLTVGSVEALPAGAVDGNPLPGIIVGKELARLLDLREHSRVNVLAPDANKGAAGFTPRIRPFRVAGIFSTGMFEYDSSLVFVTLDAARDAFALPEGQVTGIEVAVDNVYKADIIAEEITKALGGFPYYTRSWMEMNANLFAALELEKTAMFVILALIVLVGSFSIVTTLVMLVMEKTRDIAILMSMGASRSMVRRIFMLQGTIIGLVGTSLGFFLGLGVSWLLQKYQFITLPKGVYSLDHLPILHQWPDLVAVGVAAMALCFVATLYPSRQAANLEPVDALRYE